MVGRDCPGTEIVGAMPSNSPPTPAPKPLRLFVAVPAPPGVREAAAGVIARLRGEGDVRWVAPELLHLTLKFLGPTPPERVPQIEAALAKNSNSFSRFVVELERLGAFPNARRARTIWLGLRAPAELERLAQAVDEAVHPLGFPREERAFRPHLTLGRVKSARGLAGLARALEELPAAGLPAAEPWPVEEFHLVRSDLRPAGPVYTVLARFPLGDY